MDSPGLQEPAPPRSITPLDAAYRDLAEGMRIHGCTRCHAVERTELFDSRRAIEAMVEANLMPPETEDHQAGLADPAARADLLHRAHMFRVIGDAALASW